MHFDDLMCMFKSHLAHMFWMDTLPDTNVAPENRPPQLERIVFQPSIFRCELLVSGSVIPISSVESIHKSHSGKHLQSITPLTKKNVELKNGLLGNEKITTNSVVSIWMFPKIGVLSNHPF